MEEDIKSLTLQTESMLLDAIRLLEILQDIQSIEAKNHTVIRIARNNIKKSFDNIEKFKKLMSFTD